VFEFTGMIQHRFFTFSNVFKGFIDFWERHSWLINFDNFSGSSSCHIRNKSEEKSVWWQVSKIKSWFNLKLMPNPTISLYFFSSRNCCQFNYSFCTSVNPEFSWLVSKKHVPSWASQLVGLTTIWGSSFYEFRSCKFAQPNSSLQNHTFLYPLAYVAHSSLDT